MAFGLRAAGGAFGFAAVVTLAAACAPSVVVDAGKTGGGAAGQGGGGGSTTTTTTTGAGAGTTTSTTPGCPAAPPAPGSACAGAASCSYGGGDCPAMFACVNGQWAQAGDCPQPACPPGLPGGGEPCPAEGQVCSYDMACSGAQATCQNGAWWVEEYGVGCAQECPQDVPVDGSWCDVCCMQPVCEYPVKDCSPVQAFCMDAGGSNGVWRVEPGDCEPPPMSFCGFHPEQVECEGDPDCRWLVPGCSDPALPAAGCFAKQDCVSDGDCGGQHCQAAVFDPCWDKGCNACAAKAMVCLP